MSSVNLRSFVLLAAVAFWSGTSAAQGFSPQTSNQSAVTIKVTPRSLQGVAWEFEVVFDTHSQELKDDLLKGAVLVTADGTEVSPVDWKGDPPSGHHRKGVLVFNAVKPRPEVLELRISRSGESAPRSFKWDMK